MNFETIRILLADLHAGMLKVPYLGFGEVDAPSIPQEDWQRVYDHVLALPVNSYWDVFDPVDVQNHEVVWSSLADDLADIWRDLREGLSLLEQGHVAEAVWEWRNGFDTHWGHHLLSAQRAIHSQLTRTRAHGLFGLVGMSRTRRG
jgi:hypothetical protein